MSLDYSGFEWNRVVVIELGLCLGIAWALLGLCLGSAWTIQNLLVGLSSLRFAIEPVRIHLINNEFRLEWVPP